MLYFIWLYSIHRTARIHGHYHKSSDCFKYPKNAHKYKKKFLPHFPTQKNPGMENFKPKKFH